jgi:hypothetical protein
MLSRAMFSQHRSAINHLYCCHNRSGFPNVTSDHLKTLFKGLHRSFAKRKQTGGNRRVRTVEDDGTASIAAGTVATMSALMGDGSEAKDALSVDLLKLLLKWFLEWNTTDGVFAYCYLLLTWHLMCRSENTALIRLSNISWSTSFDSFQIFFSHTKTDQTGDDSTHARHLYANPHNPLLCPVTALGIYFTSCFNTELMSDHFHLFPGKYIFYFTFVFFC